jgi:hypothetical protein
MLRDMHHISTSMAPIVPEFPSKLDAGERVYPIRFSIGQSATKESSKGQEGKLALTIISDYLPCL